jgi:hypothetical protein
VVFGGNKYEFVESNNIETTGTSDRQDHPIMKKKACYRIHSRDEGSLLDRTGFTRPAVTAADLGRAVNPLRINIRLTVGAVRRGRSGGWTHDRD